MSEYRTELDMLAETETAYTVALGALISHWNQRLSQEAVTQELLDEARAEAGALWSHTGEDCLVAGRATEARVSPSGDIMPVGYAEKGTVAKSLGIGAERLVAPESPHEPQWRMAYTFYRPGQVDGKVDVARRFSLNAVNCVVMPLGDIDEAFPRLEPDPEWRRQLKDHSDQLARYLEKGGFLRLTPNGQAHHLSIYQHNASLLFNRLLLADQPITVEGHRAYYPIGAEGAERLEPMPKPPLRISGLLQGLAVLPPRPDENPLQLPPHGLGLRIAPDLPTLEKLVRPAPSEVVIPLNRHAMRVAIGSDSTFQYFGGAQPVDFRQNAA